MITQQCPRSTQIGVTLANKETELAAQKQRALAPVSSNACACTKVPSGDTTRIHAVINKELDFNLMAVFDEIMLVSELLFGSLVGFP